MTFGDNILKFMYNDSKPTHNKKYNYEELAIKCKINKDDILPILRHLQNIHLISARNKPNWVGDLDIADKNIYLSSIGIQYLEEKSSITKKIKSWGPVVISIGALIVSIIALLHSTSFS